MLTSFGLGHPAAIDLNYLSQSIRVGGTQESVFHFFDNIFSRVGSSHHIKFWVKLVCQIPQKIGTPIPFCGLILDGSLRNPDKKYSLLERLWQIYINIIIFRVGLNCILTYGVRLFSRWFLFPIWMIGCWT